MITKGAVDVLLHRVKWLKKENEIIPITEADRNAIEEQNQEFSRQGLRVLAFAYKFEEARYSEEDELIFVGLVAMMDPPREESKMAVEECKRAGIKPIMITGDHKVTAAAIAKRIGILEDESEACVSGTQDSYCACMAEQREYCCNDGRWCKRCTCVKAGRYRSSNGDHRK